jgi:hypothetical protein
MIQGPGSRVQDPHLAAGLARRVCQPSLAATRRGSRREAPGPPPRRERNAVYEEP